MIKLEFTVDQVNIILEALAELPAKKSMILIQKIHKDATDQTSQKPEENNLNE